MNLYKKTADELMFYVVFKKVLYQFKSYLEIFLTSLLISGDL